MTTLGRVMQTIRRAAGLAPDEPLSADTGLVGSGLSLDSVAVLELTVALEKEFGIKLGGAELAQPDVLSTVGTLTELVNSIVAGGR